MSASAQAVTGPASARTPAPAPSGPADLSAICRIDRHAVEPPVAQICQGITSAVQNELLRPGDRLPTVRALAADLGVAVNTVAKAFRRLEESRIVITRGRAGTVIAPRDGAAGRVERAAREYAELAAALGVTPNRAEEIVKDALRSRIS